MFHDQSRLARTSLIALCLSLLLAGCGPKTTQPNPAKSGSDANSESSSGSAEVADTTETNSLLVPFDPPPLQQLRDSNEWEVMPVVDALDLLATQKKDEPALVSVDEALQLKNDSNEANDKIISALSQLPTADAEVDYDTTIVRHSPMALKSTNPLMVSSVSEFEVMDLVSIMLTWYDRKLDCYGDARFLTRWESNKDRTVDIMTLRDDLTWSDGKPVTAHDFVFSFKTIMNPRVPIPAIRSMTDKLRWVEAYDDHTLVYFHKESMASWRENIQYPIIAKHIYEDSIDDDPTLQTSDKHQKYEDHPVTCGPYEYVSRKRNQEIVLKRRESFYMHEGKQVRAKPYAKELRIKVIEDPNTWLLALRKGDIDEARISTEQWTTNATNSDEFYEKNTKVTGLQWLEFHIIWNCETPYFSDKRVRKAMSFAFDHDEMIDKVFYGLYQKCNGPFHYTAKFYPKQAPPFYSQNLDKAEDLLDAAGWEDSDGDGIRDKEVGGKLVPFDFTLHCSTTPVSLKIGELLKDNLEQIGINCQVKPTEFTVLMQVDRDHKFHASMGGWGTGTDPATLVNIFGTGEGRNYGLYSNKEVDDLFEQGAKEFDPEKRNAIYARIHEILAEDQPYTWLYYRNSFWGFNKKLRGYNFSPRGVFGVSPGFNSLWVPAAAP